MSTRSIIARKTEEGFAGVYHHWDGYPTALGQTLYRMYRHLANNTTTNQTIPFLTELLIDEHPAGWSSINGVDWTQPVGYVTGVDDNDAPQCFCHGDRSEDGWVADQDSECGAEFAYAFESSIEDETDLLHIYERQYGDGSHTTEFFGMTSSDGGWSLIKTIDLLSSEDIDWQGII